MEALLLYLLKANVVLALFAAAYYGLLRRLTFFGLNRGYLLLALGFAAVYPALPVPALLPAALPQVAVPMTAGTGGGLAIAPQAPAFDWWQLVGLGYAAGAALLLLRLLAQLLSLGGLHRRARPATVLGQAVRVVPGTGSPFSFARTIYLTDTTLSDPQSLAAALRHEQAHVHQWHTFDVLLLQVAAALAWVNPAVWLLRRAALDNLEYLADQAALHTGGLLRRDYQYLLLRQQVGGVPAPALAFQFSILTLKNRIAMLNQPLSTTRQLGRYLLAAPLVMLLALGYAGARAQTAPASIITLDQPAAKGPAPIYYVDGKRLEPLTSTSLAGINPADIAGIKMLKNAQARQFDAEAGERELVFITTKARATAPDVVKLNNQIDTIAPVYTTEPAEINAIVPKALAYITKNYPNARLIDVTKYTRVSNGGVKYRVQLAEGRRPFYAFFTPQGDFLPE